CQEMFRLTHSDDERGTEASSNHSMGFVAAEHRDGIGTCQSLGRRLHRLEQVTLVQVMDEVRDDLSIRLAFKVETHFFQFFAKFLVVFDDAVMDNGDSL